jgi:5-methyltetrahydropteroyltriglutamate--homocysteine methyltransferase
MKHLIPDSPSILTTTVGSYSSIDWLQVSPTEQSVIDATRVVINSQRQVGIDLPTDGELYRFDINHPDTNGMIDYFTTRLGGIKQNVGVSDVKAFQKKEEMKFRRKPAGVVIDNISEGSLDLYSDCSRAAAVAGGPFKFTLTSPYMLARTLLDRHYHNFEQMLMAISDVLADQVSELPCACVQIDEANVTGTPEDGAMAGRAINRILDQISCEKAVHFCFGNYGGQSIQKGNWDLLINFLNGLHCDHLVLELAHRPEQDLEALALIDTRIALGIGVIDVKVNHVETADEVAWRIENAENHLGKDRIRWVHPDCGFWMLKRSVTERKLEALVLGRNKYLAI